MDRSNTMVASRSRIFRVTGKAARPWAPFSLLLEVAGASGEERKRKKR